MMSWLRSMPKVELHVHLDGSLRLETVLELAAQLPDEIRSELPADLASALKPADRCSLEEYLQAFDVTTAVLQTSSALERAAYEMVEDLAQENVVYFEPRFAPLLHIEQELKPRDVVTAVLAGLKRGEEAFGVRTGLLLTALKQDSTERSIEVAQLSAQFRRHGVVGFDLAGPEHDHPPREHADAVAFAHDAKVPVTLHAGEGCCPEQIADAIDLGARRIGHGVYLFRKPKTEAKAAEQKIPLEMCPTSNLQISGLMESYADHPIERYRELGIPVTVNTDNRLMSRIDLTHEFERLVEAFSYDSETVQAFTLNAIDASFASDDLKADLRETVGAFFRDLAA